MKYREKYAIHKAKDERDHLGSFFGISVHFEEIHS